MEYEGPMRMCERPKVQVTTLMAEAGAAGPETLPRTGLVTEVCREWLVHEDEAFAYRLQSEEICHHYKGNRFRNSTVRQDFPHAKEIQVQEDEDAAHWHTMYEQYVQEQDSHDAMVAQKMAEELDKEEADERIVREKQDEEYAKELLRKEREKIARWKATRELKEVEKEAKNLGHIETSPASDNLEKRLRNTHLEESGPLLGACAAPPDLTDLSDFCIKPHPDMTTEDVRQLQEDQDAELARLLQEQETKRRGDCLQQDRLLAIEAQDRELARVLQEQERGKAKRARERAKQKALTKKQVSEIPQPSDVPSSDQDCPEPYYPSASPQFNNEDNNRSRPTRPTSLDLYSAVKGVRASRNKQHVRNSLDSADIATSDTSTSSTTVPNIAMAIDPTYSRRIGSIDRNSQSEISPPNEIPPLSSTSQLSSPSQQLSSPSLQLSSPAYSLPPPPDFDEDVGMVPPYMPIQGQRRFNTPERKISSKKNKTKKEGKESCKTQ